MNRSLSTTLTRLATAAPAAGALALLIAAAPSSYALSIKDDAVSVGVKVNIQMRANFLNDAVNATGGGYDPNRATNGQSEFARFTMRRLRFGLAAKAGDWRGNLTFRGGENAGRNSASIAENVTVYYGNIGRVFKTGEAEHEIKLGLQKAFNIDESISSTTFLFPTDNALLLYQEARGIGASYKVTQKFISVGVDFQNNTTGTKPATAGDNSGNDQVNGYYYSARLEVSPGASWWIVKKQESFWGKEGTGLNVGFDISYEDRKLDLTPGAGFTYRKSSELKYGPDALFHWNYLTLLAAARWGKAKNTDYSNTASSTLADVTKQFLSVQAGWAIPIGEKVLEPAIRLTKMDNDRRNKAEATVYGNAENGNSGRQVDLGLNLYWKGHDVKTQLAFTRWNAETGSGKANIVRLQQQFNY